jgi:MFS family permease
MPAIDLIILSEQLFTVVKHGPLRGLAFRRYWIAQTVSYLGDQVTIVALPLVAVLALDASAAQMGLLAAAGSLPNLLFSLHAGAIVDRRGRRRGTMIVTDLLRAALLASVPVAYWLGALTLAHLYAVAFLAGSLSVFFVVCTNSLFTALLPRDQYVEGTSLMRGSYAFSWVAGPSAGGVLVQVLSGPAALVLDAVSFLGSALLLGSIAPEEPPGEPAARGRIREGLSFVARNPALRAQFAAGAGLNFFYTIYFALLFLFAARELDLSAGTIGLALGAGAVGALLGTAVTTRATRRIGLGRALLLGAFLYPGALLLVPLASGPSWLAFALLVVAEFGSGLGLALDDICATSMRQALTPDRLRSRVQGAYMALNYGVRPLGALAGGALGTWLGLRPTLWLAAAGGVASALLLLPSPIPRMRELPAEAT